MAGFVVFGLPRSRTFWLSRFLTYGGWACEHEALRYVRSPADVAAWLSLPLTGSVETAAAPFWRTLRALAPDTRVVLVRRDPAAVLASLARLGIAFDAEVMATAMRRLDAKLDQIAARWPGVLSVSFDGLAGADACAAVFSHCLGLPFDRPWWQAMARLDLQCDMPALLRYLAAFQPALEKVAAQIRHQTLAGMTRPATIEGVTFQQEPFDAFYRDARGCFADHLVQTGQAPDDHTRKNLPLLRALDTAGALQIVTARSRNGLMHGYLMTVIGPSLDAPDVLEAMHTIFYAAPDVRGLGLKLQRAALEGLRARGVGEVILRAGVRGAGPRLGTLYRRLGAEPFGELYRLTLEA